MRKPQIFRRYSLERDDKGLVKALHWLGDVVVPAKPTKAEMDARRLAEHERIYGTRTFQPAEGEPKP